MGRGLLVEQSWRSAEGRTRSEIRVIPVSAEQGRGVGRRVRSKGSDVPLTTRDLLSSRIVTPRICKVWNSVLFVLDLIRHPCCSPMVADLHVLHRASG